jgi:hypothetical protein
MTYEDLIRELRARKALIVHFSHHAKMRGEGTFPEDLHAAIASSRAWPLSCSVVWPGHRLALVGSVGVVLHPRSLSSIIGVRNDDGGSSTLPDGTENTACAPLDETGLKDTFEPPAGGYNEWRMRECDVIGVYVESSEGLPLAKKRVTIEVPGQAPIHDISAERRGINEVIDAFPELPIYTFAGSEIAAIRVPPSTVYPWILTSAPAPVYRA